MMLSYEDSCASFSCASSALSGFGSAAPFLRTYPFSPAPWASTRM